MECEPAESEPLAHCAWPAERVTPVQMLVAPSLKMTLPVAEAPTVAVKVTVCARLDGFAEDVSDGVVATSDASKAPMDGGLGRAVPSKSVEGAPAALAAPFAGEFRRSRRSPGAAWNSGSPLMKLVPTLSPP